MKTFLSLFFCFVLGLTGDVRGQSLISEEDALNLSCLRMVYPQIRTLEEDEEGLWLVFEQGERVLYARRSSTDALIWQDAGDGDVKRRMEQPYMLEPDRPKSLSTNKRRG